MSDVYTQSSLKTFCRCPTEYLARYEHGLVRHGRSGAMELGTALHAALEVLFKTGLIDQAEAKLNEWGPLAGNQGLPADDFIRAKAMLAGYYAKWGDPRKEFDVLTVERTFSIPIANSNGVLQGKIDTIVRDRGTGRLQLWDHKTTSEFDQAYIVQRWMDLQLYVYTIGAREALGFNVEECVYDVLIKPGGRRKKGESDGELFDRFVADCGVDKYERPVYTINPRILERTRKEIVGRVAQIELAKATGFWGQNYSACKTYSWCPYFDLCASGWSKVVVDNGYAVIPPHRELKEEPDADCSTDGT